MTDPLPTLFWHLPCAQYARALLNVQLVFVFTHHGVTSEEGTYVSVLHIAHLTFVWLFNGIFGFVWYVTFPKEALENGHGPDPGWIVIFGLCIFIGILYGLELYGALFDEEQNPDNMRTFIINRFREALPDYATDIFSEGISVVLFQLLTTTNQLVLCDGGKALADVLNRTTPQVNG